MDALAGWGRTVRVVLVLTVMTFSLGVPAAAVWTWKRVWKFWATAAGLFVVIRLSGADFVVAGSTLDLWLISGVMTVSVALFTFVFVLIAVRAWKTAWDELMMIRTETLDYPED